MANEHAFFWSLPVLMTLVVALQLYYGRVVIGAWRTMERGENGGRFWLFIVAESVAVLVLVGQAIYETT
jgi:hypothetical protein